MDATIGRETPQLTHAMSSPTFSCLHSPQSHHVASASDTIGFRDANPSG